MFVVFLLEQMVLLGPSGLEVVRSIVSPRDVKESERVLRFQPESEDLLSSHETFLKRKFVKIKDLSVKQSFSVLVYVRRYDTVWQKLDVNGSRSSCFKISS